MTAKTVTLDIETYRTTDQALVEGIRQQAILKRPARNTLKRLKECWDTEAARNERAADALAKTSVDPLLAEVLCVAVQYGNLEPRIWSAMGGTDGIMLRGLAEELVECTDIETIWVGHNLKGFDLPILVNRFRRCGVVPPAHFPVPTGPRHVRGRVYDTMLRVPSQNAQGYISLEAACAAYGLPAAKGAYALEDGRLLTGATVGSAFEAGEYELIEKYCMEDVAATYRLYQACTMEGRWGTWESDSELEHAITTIWKQGMNPDAAGKVVLDLLAGAGKIPRWYAGRTPSTR